ncbi:ABC transporter ATP-binding protein [Neolewinella aurantiaca]|uniref:ABC transporter ATP-binding protein n=1 Tax=Neolewinella aurantiaca TaxID=2602767 RepID=A0A5C7FAF1_9BACT|nr:ABC transporter ATP-binding protein [Neolewinella aurantiaca]TXF87113.1 ABC transporter ATP-binding protein [Neolewinella aurantiaca]
MSSPVITLTELAFRVEDRDILRGVNLSIERGETFALLGSNGAGKSTLLSMISGNQRPTEGEAIVFGQAPKTDSRVSILSDVVPLFPMLKVKEIIQYFDAFYGRAPNANNELVEVLELGTIFNKLFRTLSKGQRKRVGLYLALASKPELLIMDEPTSDLDPLIREQIWKRLLNDPDMTVLFTTHDWEEARAYADRLTFIHDGALLTQPATPQALLTSPEGIGARKLVIPTTAADEGMIADLRHVRLEDEYHIFADGRTEELVSRLSRVTLNFSVLDSTLQDAYQYLIKTKTA